MSGNDSVSGEDIIANSHDLLADCLTRISAGDPMGAHDLANFWMAHVFDRDPVIELGIVEGLMRQSAQLGSADARAFLDGMWPNMRPILEKRLLKSKN